MGLFVQKEKNIHNFTYVDALTQLQIRFYGLIRLFFIIIFLIFVLDYLCGETVCEGSHNAGSVLFVSSDGGTNVCEVYVKEIQKSFGNKQ